MMRVGVRVGWVVLAELTILGRKRPSVASRPLGVLLVYIYDTAPQFSGLILVVKFWHKKVKSWELADIGGSARCPPKSGV